VGGSGGVARGGCARGCVGACSHLGGDVGTSRGGVQRLMVREVEGAPRKSAATAVSSRRETSWPLTAPKQSPTRSAPEMCVCECMVKVV